MHDRRVFEVPADLVGERLQQRKVLVERALHGVAMAAEPDHAIADGEHEQSLGEPLDGEQPQDDRVAQGPPAQHDRRVFGRSGEARLTQYEVTAPQAPPRLTDRRRRVQALAQVVFGRRVGHVSAPGTGPQVPVHLTLIQHLVDRHA
jgi:hypothetical protein